MFALYRDLLALREEEPMLLPDGAELAVDEADGCITLLRTPRRDERNAGALLAMFNCTDAVREVPLPTAATGRWTLRLTTDATGYGGEGRVVDAWSVERGAWSEQQPAWNERAAAERGRVDALGVTTATDEPRRLLDSEVQPTVSMPPWCAALFTLASSP